VPPSSSHALRAVVGLLLVASSLVAVGAPTQGAPSAEVERFVVGLAGGPAAGTDLGVGVVEVLAPLPFAIVEATPAALADLQQRGRITTVERDADVRPALDGALALSGAPAAWGGGPRGGGQAIVVIDTGLRTNHPGVAGRVVGEACFVERADGRPGCPGGASSAVGPGAAATCSRAACLHGTYTAVAAAGAAGPDATGVAPGASLYPIRVVDFASSGCASGCARYSDVLRALRHVATDLVGTLDLAAVNVSLQIGATRHTSRCDAAFPALAAVVAQLAASGDGVAVVAPSGNQGTIAAAGAGLAVPACVASVVSVGATATSRSVAAFSQFSRDLDLLAPGSGIDVRTSSAGALGPTTRLSGTSLAAAQVSGGLALARELLPGAGLPERLALLRASGVPVVDTRPTGPDLVVPRLRLRTPVPVGGGLLVPGGAPVGGRSLVGDFDADGVDDLLDAGAAVLAYGGRDRSFDRRSVGAPPAGTPLVGNFVGRPDSPDDVLWAGPAGGVDVLWTGRSDRSVRTSTLRPAIVRAAVVGDFDGDGLDDVLWLAGGGAPGALWTGGPTGFTKVRFDLVPGRSVVGDIDGDGADDLLIIRAADVVELRPGSPDVAFEGRVSGLTDLPVALADLDGDGDLDAVLAGPPRWQPYDGPAFGPPRDLPGGPATSSVAAVDLDGDGRDELVSAGPGSGTVHLGGGATVRSSVLTGGAPLPATADLDGDGRAEVVWRAPTGGTEIWWSWR
jgi:hypothetical protein